MLEEAKPIFLVEAQDDLGIAFGFELIAFRFERAPDPFEVVNLAIGGEHDGAVFAPEWLGPRLKVNHREPRVGERDLRGRVDEQSASIRSAMIKTLENALQRGLSEFGTDRAKNPAHAF